MPKAGQTNSNQPQAITGIQAMQGHGVKQARGFWAEAWSQVIRRFSAIIGFSWLGLVAFFAVTAPFVANGHPLRMVRTEDGQRVVTYPLFQSLTAADWLLLIAAVAGGIFIAVPLSGLKRPKRLGWVIVAMVCGTIITLLITLLRSNIFDRVFGAIRELERTADGTQVASYPIIAITIAASIGVLALLWIPFAQSIMTRLIWLAIAASVTAGVIGATWNNRAPIFNYTELELRSDVQTTYTIIPWSPNQRPSDRNTRTMGPGQTDAQALVRNFNNAVSNYLDAQRRPVTDPFGPEGFRIARSVLTTQPLEPDVQASLLEVINRLEAENPEAVRRDLRYAIEAELSTVGKRFPLGTDNQGQDMLSQLLHACRLSISIGLVSTGISLIIGITVGALMGYFGGWVDLILYRFVEIFMAIPVLFLLIVAAGVLPKNIYVMMIIIGCFSWTGAARFIRAEFLKLRNMDFVQSARATGLPLRSILFKHMLPNGVTPVLVESSFAIAAAILAEATLSYLGLGPDDQASWGKLLASATGQSGEFFWWLAIFPGMAIFLTVLSYNLIGEALRDAIDPKLKKARV
jgi:ABC-type dipeptide/oligopeptide/nickel transport system permease subunit